MPAKTWKPRTHTPQLQQRTQRRVAALQRVEDDAPLPEFASRMTGKIHQIVEIYGPDEAFRRIEAAYDRLLTAGVQ